MLKKFQVTNYKNFRTPITIDFSKVSGYHFNMDCITNQLISKMVVYGRNSTGKTNLGHALFDIRNCLFSSPSIIPRNRYFVNADSVERYAYFEYTFQFGDDEVIYNYKRLHDTSLLEEEMFINGTRIFHCDFIKMETDFSNLSQVSAETIQTQRYVDSLLAPTDDESETLEALPFFRWLTSNAALSSESVLIKLYFFILRMRGFGVKNPNSLQYFTNFYNTLAEGTKLREFEEFLNVMGVKCKLLLQKNIDGQYQLYFDHNTPIPFYETASSGTIALARLFSRLENFKNAPLIYLDEFDAYYHYEMSEKVVRYLKHICPNSQIIFTTHNTNLMSNHLMRPDCLCILSRSGKLTALCDATHRELREGHNLEKMYISGEFDSYE